MVLITSSGSIDNHRSPRDAPDTRDRINIFGVNRKVDERGTGSRCHALLRRIPDIRQGQVELGNGSAAENRALDPF